MPAPAFSVATRKIAVAGPGMRDHRERIQHHLTKADFLFLVKHLLNIGAGNGAREARIYFPISSFKAPDTFQIS